MDNISKKKAELMQAYDGYIQELAKDHLEGKPINEAVLKFADDMHKEIRNIDIAVAVANLKKEKTVDHSIQK